MSVADLFGILHTFGIEDVTEALTSAQQEVAFAAAREMGVPAEVTIFFGKHTIGGTGAAFTTGGKAADGKGIDHFFVAQGEALVTAYFIGLAPPSE